MGFLQKIKNNNKLLQDLSDDPTNAPTSPNAPTAPARTKPTTPAPMKGNTLYKMKKTQNYLKK